VSARAKTPTNAAVPPSRRSKRTSVLFIGLESHSRVVRYNFKMNQLFAIFITVFLAELGDKTQLATLLFATDQQVSKTHVFLAASAALVASTFLAVVAGEMVTRMVSPYALRMAAGVGFVAIGAWVLVTAARV
jgi:putative Ca2+/H+ antiporter (TMEM165/GDT1 family)